MRVIPFIIIFILLSSMASFAQHDSNMWERFEYLIGTWEGEGNGKPGQGKGIFSFKLDLDKNILLRTSHSEYPPMQGRPAATHNDLMIIYRDSMGAPNKAIYFDNEQHVINYSITFSENKNIVFTSDKIPNSPRFRLTYKVIDDVTVDTIFEISKDGEHFFTYIQGKSKRREQK